MKKLIVILSLMLTGCSSISLVENWKNPDIVIFNANKVLIVGMAQNDDTRDDFETKLQKEFTSRDVEAWRSIDIFDLSLTDSRKTEKELDDVEQSLLDKDFDAILLTKIIGSESREKFVKSITRWDDHQSRFNDDYLEHQGIYYDDNYYDQYTIYHAETTLYCICEGKERAMIWRGIIEINEPDNIDKAIKDYVKMIIVAMEDQDLVFTSQIE
ncbi:hypothetical protein [Maribacter ulvicola]|uniref:Cardiolipin synthetase n=1 Tax=Maribacter ulvicola TaxID=228959 RepID=A0A1N6Z3J5_9FLAO|nr:hypothetical protein [Maribacter ulvicola]SIR21375.1 hypothetical protein SAMN05421797_10813 [Maribacter ulvicola]